MVVRGASMICAIGFDQPHRVYARARRSRRKCSSRWARPKRMAARPSETRLSDRPKWTGSAVVRRNAMVSTRRSRRSRGRSRYFRWYHFGKRCATMRNAIVAKIYVALADSERTSSGLGHSPCGSRRRHRQRNPAGARGSDATASVGGMHSPGSPHRAARPARRSRTAAIRAGAPIDSRNCRCLLPAMPCWATSAAKIQILSRCQRTSWRGDRSRTRPRAGDAGDHYLVETGRQKEQAKRRVSRSGGDGAEVRET